MWYCLTHKIYINMAKFLSIPVASEQKQLVSADGIILLEQASTTTVVITYASAKAVTVTHAASAAGSEEVRDYLQDSIVFAQQQPWHQVKYVCDALPKAVSAIVVA